MIDQGKKPQWLPAISGRQPEVSSNYLSVNENISLFKDKYKHVRSKVFDEPNKFTDFDVKKYEESRRFLDRNKSISSNEYKSHRLTDEEK